MGVRSIGRVGRSRGDYVAVAATTSAHLERVSRSGLWVLPLGATHHRAQGRRRPLPLRATLMLQRDRRGGDTVVRARRTIEVFARAIVNRGLSAEQPLRLLTCPGPGRPDRSTIVVGDRRSGGAKRRVCESKEGEERIGVLAAAVHVRWMSEVSWRHLLGRRLHR